MLSLHKKLKKLISKLLLRESIFQRVILSEFNNQMALNYCPHGVEKYFCIKLEIIFNQSQKQSICNWQVIIDSKSHFDRACSEFIEGLSVTRYY